MINVVWPVLKPIDIQLSIYPLDHTPNAANLVMEPVSPHDVILSGSIHNLSPINNSLTAIVIDAKSHNHTAKPLETENYYSFTINGFLAPVVIMAQQAGEKFKPNYSYQVGDIVRPVPFMSVVYHIVVAGVSDSSEPQWWLPLKKNNTGMIGTAKAMAIEYRAPLAHGPIEVAQWNTQQM